MCVPMNLEYPLQDECANCQWSNKTFKQEDGVSVPLGPIRFHLDIKHLFPTHTLFVPSQHDPYEPFPNYGALKSVARRS